MAIATTALVIGNSTAGRCRARFDRHLARRMPSVVSGGCNSCQASDVRHAAASWCHRRGSSRAGDRDPRLRRRHTPHCNDAVHTSNDTPTTFHGACCNRGANHPATDDAAANHRGADRRSSRHNTPDYITAGHHATGHHATTGNDGCHGVRLHRSAATE